jgi:protein TonB
MMLVVLLHLMLGYALLHGLGKTLVDVIRPANPVTIVPDAPPPTPPERTIPKPEVAPIRDVVIPAPDFKIDTPLEPTVTATPVENPAPVSTDVVQGVRNDAPIVSVRKEYKAAYRVDPGYPREAQRQGITGKVVARAYVAPSGVVTRVQIMSSTNPAFEREVIRALSQWKFAPETVGFVGEYEIAFNLRD